MALGTKAVRFTFLGCGHIGTALLKALLPPLSQPDSPISQITVALKRKDSEARLRLQFRHSPTRIAFVSGQNLEAVRTADAVLLAFPPEQIHEVLGATEMRDALRQKMIISILARTPLSEITQLLQQGHQQDSMVDDGRLIRAMPTLGTGVHESATLLASPGTSREEEVVELATWIFNIVGKVYHVSQDYFDTATGMSAFCNALTAVAAQAITERAVAEGVPIDHAVAITSQCIRGAASLMLAGASPEQLQRSLSTPGSITGHAIAGLQDSQLRNVLESSLSAAIVRARNYHKQ